MAVARLQLVTTAANVAAAAAAAAAATILQSVLCFRVCDVNVVVVAGGGERSGSCVWHLWRYEQSKHSVLLHVWN